MAVLDKISGIPILQRAIIVALLIVLILVLFFYTVYSPNKKKLAALNAQLATLNSEVQDLRAIKLKLSEFKLHQADLQGRLDVARKQLPREKEIPVLLDAISKFGNESGMEFVSFRPGAETSKGSYAEVPVNLVIKGPYHNLGLFLDKISHYPRIIKVSDIVLGEPKEEGGYVMLRSTCLATTYRDLEQGN
jgi:type IV pilus assembly protein PilO